MDQKAQREWQAEQRQRDLAWQEQRRIDDRKWQLTQKRWDREVAQLAKAAAALDGLNLAEWLSETIRPIAEKRLARPSVKTPKKLDE